MPKNEPNEEVVCRMVEAINRRDLSALDDLVAEDVQRHSAATAGLTINNRAQFKAFLEQDFVAVPDSRIEIDLMFSKGDLVAVRALYRGTQRGNWGPFPPSNKVLELPYISILRVTEGRIAELWVEWDNLSALQQLGHFPVG